MKTFIKELRSYNRGMKTDLKGLTIPDLIELDLKGYELQLNAGILIYSRPLTS
jgi:hypothetical protein